jgi:hypothetical protein
MKTNYVYLKFSEEVYRLTRRNYQRFLRKNERQGYPPDLTEYGKLLCIIDHDMTNWDFDDVRRELGHNV